MPYTQDRALALLQAAEDCYGSLERLSRQIKFWSSEIEQGRATPLQAFGQLAAQADLSMLLGNPIHVAQTIARERQHFSLSTIRRNNKLKLVNERKRREKGIPPLAESHALRRPQKIDVFTETDYPPYAPPDAAQIAQSIEDAEGNFEADFFSGLQHLSMDEKLKLMDEIKNMGQET